MAYSVESKKIGNREEFINYIQIQSQMITIAIIEGNLDEAKRIGNKEKYRNYAPIQNQMIIVAKKEKKQEEQQERY